MQNKELNKLKGRIVECYGSNRGFAREIGVSESTVSLKLSCKVGFSRSNIDNWAKKLDIPLEQYGEYFFP